MRYLDKEMNQQVSNVYMYIYICFTRWFFSPFLVTSDMYKGPRFVAGTGSLCFSRWMFPLEGLPYIESTLLHGKQGKPEDGRRYRTLKPRKTYMATAITLPFA